MENSSSCKGKGLAPKKIKKNDELKFASPDCVSGAWLLFRALLLVISERPRGIPRASGSSSSWWSDLPDSGKLTQS